MGNQDPALLTRVSYHAVTRYLQRIVGMPPIAKGAEGSELCAEAHCAAAGLSIDDVRRLILTPAVVVALRMGAATVRSSNMTVKLARNDDGNAVVVTILENRTGFHGRRIMRDNDRDGRRFLRRAIIAERRRPSRALLAKERPEP